MKNYKDKIVSVVKVFTLAMILSVGVSYVLAQGWEPPAPPDHVAHPPLNVSDVSQTKEGALWSDLLLGAPVFCLYPEGGISCITEWPEADCPNGINSITLDENSAKFDVGCL